MQNRKFYNILHLHNKSGRVLSIFGSKGQAGAATSLLEEGETMLMSEARRKALVHRARKERLKRLVGRLVAPGSGGEEGLRRGRSLLSAAPGPDAIDATTSATEKAVLAAWQGGADPGTGQKAKPTPLADAIKVTSGLTVTGAIMSTPSGDVEVGPDLRKVKQWKLLFEDDFHKGSVEDWTRVSHAGTKDEKTKAANSEVSTCARFPHANSDYFLGAFGNVRVRRVYNQLPAHDFVRVTGRVHLIDKWNGEFIFLDVDGKRKWSATHRFCSEFFETMCNPNTDNAKYVDSCGNTNFADAMSVPFDISFRHTEPTTGAALASLKVEVGVDFSSGACLPGNTCPVVGYTCLHGLCINTGASWGLDDVRVYVM